MAEFYEKDAEIAHRLFDLKVSDPGAMGMFATGVVDSVFDLWAAKFIGMGYQTPHGQYLQTNKTVRLLTVFVDIKLCAWNRWSLIQEVMTRKTRPKKKLYSFLACKIYLLLLTLHYVLHFVMTNWSVSPF